MAACLLSLLADCTTGSTRGPSISLAKVAAPRPLDNMSSNC
jgi:hypothetical protein